MADETPPTSHSDPAPSSKNENGLSGIANWLSLTGAVLTIGAIFAFVLLFFLDVLSGHSNAYLGVLTFMVAPGFGFLGLVMMLTGWIYYRVRLAKKKAAVSPMRFAVDLTRKRDRKKLVLFVGSAFVFFILTALGSYRTYHFTESVMFCGEVCHEVMKPEFKTYLASPHARVSCAECHIGAGATWYVKSKISGLYQVYATAMNKYPRPIETPIKNLRPAQDTCEQCHWPQKFTGNMVRRYPHTLSDDENTPYTVNLLLKVGGGNPSKGPVGGIHWHTDPRNKIEYIAADEKRLEIPWVRMTEADGTVTVFKTDGFEDAINESEIQVMDCIDCHNRPAHILLPPNTALDQAFDEGQLSRDLAGLKALAAELLVDDYENEEQAMAAISQGIHEEYADENPLVVQAVETVQGIYSQNFFPYMNARWDVYPEHIGHKNWPGCFRCHDGEHYAEAQEDRVLQANDCNSCHTILAQGNEEELKRIVFEGMEFEHPEGPTLGLLCSDCHTGGPQ